MIPVRTLASVLVHVILFKLFIGYVTNREREKARERRGELAEKITAFSSVLPSWPTYFGNFYIRKKFLRVCFLHIWYLYQIFEGITIGNRGTFSLKGWRVHRWKDIEKSGEIVWSRQCDSLVHPFATLRPIFAYRPRNTINPLAISHCFDAAIKSRMQMLLHKRLQKLRIIIAVCESFLCELRLYPFEIGRPRFIRIIAPSGSSLHRCMERGREIAWPICIQRRRKKKKKKRNVVRYPRVIPGSRTLSAEVWPVEEVAGKHRGHGKRSAVRCLVFSRPWNRRSTYTCFTRSLCTLKGWVVLVERRRSRLLFPPLCSVPR